MTREELSKALTVRHGGSFTKELAFALGVSRAKLWRILRDLEIAGVLEGYARDKHGDSVPRGLDGKPTKVGAEVQWFACAENEGVSPESDAAAARILAAVAP